MSAAAPWVDNLTIGQVLERTSTRFGECTAAVFCQENVRYTWRELACVVEEVARGLSALGLTRGMHLGVWSTNWPQWLLLQLATARLGVVLVTINPAYRAEELSYALAQADVAALALLDRFRSTDFFAVLEQACPDVRHAQRGRVRSDKYPHLQWLIQMRGAPHPSALSWEALLAAGVGISLPSVDELGLSPADPINLQYTSGTTGHPRGALLTHRNLLLNAYHIAQCQQLDERDRICVPVPLYHCFGCVLGTLCALVSGAALVFPHESFQPAATLAALETERCTALYGVPTMFLTQLEHPDYRQHRFPALRTGVMAGSPCPVELMKRVTGELGAREIVIGYGQTEASPIITMTRTDDPLDKRVHTVGRPLPDVEVRIVDAETGVPLADGEAGELCCRGPNVMLGYYHLPEATAAAIDGDGWLHTGDLAVRQSDGYFRITGRIKDMIIRGGENIAPREIEEVLYRHAAVEEVQVIGVPDAKYGEEICAWIKLRRDAQTTCDELRAFCREHLAHFKTPRYIQFVEQFPLTVTGKIQKFRMRALAIEQLGLQSAADEETA